MYIQNYCKIEPGKVTLNGALILEDKLSGRNEFFKSVYKNFEIKYSKFFKMDNLCKLAFLSAELLLKDLNKDCDRKKVGVVFSNNAGSLDTDRKHQESIEDRNNYYPSPAVFVYTLPNITIGEVSIRHKLQGECAFFVTKQYDHSLHHIYERSLIIGEKCENVLGGWINLDNHDYKAFLYLVSNQGTLEHTAVNLNKIYKE